MGMTSRQQTQSATRIIPGILGAAAIDASEVIRDI
jgi:hypothetical protein